MKSNSGKQPQDLPIILSGILLGVLVYYIVMEEIPLSLSDYHGHLYVYLPLFHSGSWLEAWKTTPYCLWHILVLLLNSLLHVPLEASAAFISSVFHVFSYLVTCWMIQRYAASRHFEISSVEAAAAAFGLSVVQGLYFDWLDISGAFLGIFSINALHNPTQTAVRAFVLLCFCLVCDIRGRQKDKQYHGIFFSVEKGLKKYYVLLAVLLLLSTLAKPVFAEMFIPAVGLIMLFEWLDSIFKKDGLAAVRFRHCLHMLLCALPSLACILLQFIVYYIWGRSYGEASSVIVTDFLEVWSLFSENIILSIVLGMAFPLFMLLIDGSFFMKNDMGKLSLTGYGVGFLEAAFLGESGEKLSHGNFLWPMMCGMLLVWVTALLRLIELSKKQDSISTSKRILLDTAWVLFCFHVLFGFLYTNSLLSK